MKNPIEAELKDLEEQEVLIAKRREDLLNAKKEADKRAAALDKLVDKSGYSSAKELVEALVERYNVRLTGKVANKAARRTRTRMTAELRDQIKAQFETKSMNQVAKETGISYIVIAKVKQGAYDKL